MNVRNEVWVLTPWTNIREFVTAMKFMSSVLDEETEEKGCSVYFLANTSHQKE